MGRGRDEAPDGICPRKGSESKWVVGDAVNVLPMGGESKCERLCLSNRLSPHLGGKESPSTVTLPP